MRRPLVIYDFAPDPSEFSYIVYEEKFFFFSVSGIFLTRYQTGGASVRGPRYPDDTRINEVWKYYVY